MVVFNCITSALLFDLWFIMIYYCHFSFASSQPTVGRVRHVGFYRRFPGAPCIPRPQFSYRRIGAQCLVDVYTYLFDYKVLGVDECIEMFRCVDKCNGCPAFGILYKRLFFEYGTHNHHFWLTWTKIHPLLIRFTFFSNWIALNMSIATF